MVDSKNNPDNCKTLEISIAKIIEDHLKTRKICKNAVKKLPFIIWHGVPIDVRLKKCVIKLC